MSKWGSSEHLSSKPYGFSLEWIGQRLNQVGRHLCQLTDSETRIFLNNVRFGNCRPGSSWIRGIFEWSLTRTEFCKPPINFGKRNLFIPINKAYLIMCAFETQYQPTAGFYITPDFRNILYSFSIHLQRSVYDYIRKQSNRWVDFKFINTPCNVIISHPFLIGFVQVNSVIVKYTMRLQNISNTPRTCTTETRTLDSVIAV